MRSFLRPNLRIRLCLQPLQLCACITAAYASIASTLKRRGLHPGVSDVGLSCTNTGSSAFEAVALSPQSQEELESALAADGYVKLPPLTIAPLLLDGLSTAMDKLAEMGYSGGVAVAALLRAGGDVMAAANLLAEEESEDCENDGGRAGARKKKKGKRGKKGAKQQVFAPQSPGGPNAEGGEDSDDSCGGRKKSGRNKGKRGAGGNGGAVGFNNGSNGTNSTITGASGATHLNFFFFHLNQYNRLHKFLVFQSL